MTRNYKKMISVILMSLMLVNTQVFANKIDGKHEADKAAEIAKIKVKKSPEGFFFRGDSRETHEIFASGFQPQGSNADLTAHLSFRGDSGYVSTTRSDITAQRYVYGRTSEHNTDGYMYVIAPDELADGYWIPGIYPNDPAVQRNQEYAVFGAIPSRNIVGAFHYFGGSDTPAEWVPNPNYAFASSSPYNPSRDSYFQDICGAIAAIAAYICVKPAPQP